MEFQQLINEMKEKWQQNEANASLDGATLEKITNSMKKIKEDIAIALYSNDHKDKIRELIKDKIEERQINYLLKDPMLVTGLPNEIVLNDYVINNILLKQTKEQQAQWEKDYEEYQISSGIEEKDLRITYPHQSKIEEKVKTLTNPEDIEFIQMLGKDVLAEYPDGMKLVSFVNNHDNQLTAENKKLLEKTEYAKIKDSISDEIANNTASQEHKEIIKSLFQKENRPKSSEEVTSKQMILREFIEKNLIIPDHEVKGEEGKKVYSAAKFYRHYKNISDIITSDNPINNKEAMDALRNEYKAYQKEKEIFIQGLDLVRELFKDPYYFPGNMDLSRTPGMPKDVVLRVKDVSILNSVWIANSYAKKEGLDFQEMLKDPTIILEKSFKNEQERLTNLFKGKNLEETMIHTLKSGKTSGSALFAQGLGIQRTFDVPFSFGPNKSSTTMLDAYNALVYAEMPSNQEDFFREVGSQAKNAYLVSYLFAKETDVLNPNAYVKRVEFDYNTFTVKKYSDRDLYDMAESLRAKNQITNEQLIEKIHRLETVAASNNIDLGIAPRRAIFEQLTNGVLNREKTNEHTQALILEAKRLSSAKLDSSARNHFNANYPDTFVGNLKYLLDYSVTLEHRNMAIQYAKNEVYKNTTIDKNLENEVVKVLESSNVDVTNLKEPYKAMVKEFKDSVTFSEMDLFKNKVVTEQAKHEFETKLNWTIEILNKNPQLQQNLFGDDRDYPLISAMLFDFEGANEEERKTNFVRQATEFIHLSQKGPNNEMPDPEICERYIGKYIDKLNNFNSRRMNPNSVEDVKEAIGYLGSAQAATMKTVEYRNFLLNRYVGNEEKQKEFNDKLDFMERKMYVGSMIMSKSAYNNGFEFKFGSSTLGVYKKHSITIDGQRTQFYAKTPELAVAQEAVKANPDNSEDVYGDFMYEKMAVMINEALEYGSTKDSIKLNLPSELRDLSTENNSLHNFVVFLEQLASPEGDSQSLKFKEMDLEYSSKNRAKQIFIDGKSVDQLAQESGKTSAQIIAEALDDRTKIMEIANLDQTGNIKITKLDFDFKEVRPKESYPLYRQILDSMKFWKIDPNKKYQKAIEKANQPEEKAKRHAAIKSSWGGFIEANAKNKDEISNYIASTKQEARELDTAFILEDGKSLDVSIDEPDKSRVRISVHEANTSSVGKNSQNNKDDLNVSISKDVNKSVGK